jgi:hypothetical protein
MRKDRHKGRNKQPDRRVQPRTARRKWLLAAGGGVVVVAMVVVSAALLTSRDRQPPEARAPSPSVVPSEGRLEAQRLVGNWLRPDGGYVLGIRAVDPTGRVEATYSNPRPIHVAQANTSSTGSTIKLFVELRDVGYPGSTYDLTYDPNNDMLQGIYFQAQIQQSFDVVFVRMNGSDF